MPLNLTDGKSTLVQIMVWHCQATSHYLNQAQPSSSYGITRVWWVNSLAPGRFEWNSRSVSFKVISVIDGWEIICEIALRWMSLDLSDDNSTLVQVMAWCHQATSHYLNQCWPYGITRPQWVNCKYLVYALGWVGLWGFLWWAPSAKRKDHHEERPPRGQLWMEQCLTPLKYWPI